jgi:nitrite reductase/ring-hydroxylating ferredoxin subunit
MHSKVIELLVHHGVHASLHFAAHYLGSGSHGGARRVTCRGCGAGFDPRQGAILDGCCGASVCLACLKPMVTGLGDGSVRVHCGFCGDRRVARLR